MSTGTVKPELSADGRAFTLTVDTSDPANFELTSKGKSHLVASTGWVKDPGTGLTYTLVVVSSFERSAELAAMQAGGEHAGVDGATGQTAAEVAAMPGAKPARARTRKAAA